MFIVLNVILSINYFNKQIFLCNITFQSTFVIGKCCCCYYYYYYYYYYYTIWMSLVTGLFFLVLLLNQR